jgi:O-antigen ligase
MPPFGADQFEARHAENELLQQFFAYGVAGIVMLGGIYGSLYWRIRRLPHRPTKIIFLTILLFIVIRGMAEAEPFDLLLPLWAITLISSIIATPFEANGERTAVTTAPNPGATNLASRPARRADL